MQVGYIVVMRHWEVGLKEAEQMNQVRMARGGASVPPEWTMCEIDAVRPRSRNQVDC